jgi:hypothetical protein
MVIGRRREPSATGFGPLLRAEGDVKARGGSVSLGVTWRPVERLEISALGILGPTFGAHVGAALYLGGGTFRPKILLGPTIFFDESAVAGLHGGLGIQKLFGRVELFLEVGLEWFPSAPDGVEAVQIMPGVGVQVWL